MSSNQCYAVSDVVDCILNSDYTVSDEKAYSLLSQLKKILSSRTEIETDFVPTSHQLFFYLLNIVESLLKKEYYDAAWVIATLNKRFPLNARNIADIILFTLEKYLES